MGNGGNCKAKGCGKPLPAGRRSWCSDFCSRKMAPPNSTRLREKVLARDRGICAACGLDTVAFWSEIQALSSGEREARLAELKVSYRFNYWDADHVTFLVEGGSSEDLANVRTLCVACHRVETRNLHAKGVRRRLGWRAEAGL